MNTTLATFVLCFAFLYLLEGIEQAMKSKANKVYKITHICYPLFMVAVMLYFLAYGISK